MSLSIFTGSAGALDSFSLDRIRYHAHRLSRRPVFRGTDRRDLEQELALDLLKAIPKFNPSRASRNTFVCRVIARRCLTLLRDAHRRFREHCSLDEITHSDADLRSRLLNHPSRDDTARRERAAAVRAAVTQLPLSLRRIAELLMTHSQAQTARVLGVSETTIDRARKQIQAHFAELDDDWFN